MNTAQERWRLSLAYFLYFIALGLYAPYFPAYLAGRGLDAVTIGWVLALNPLTRTLLPPLFGFIVDRTSALRVWLRIVAWGATVGLCIIGGSQGRSVLIVGALCYFIFNAPLTPLLDVAALGEASGAPNRYGYIRSWGSFGFLLSSFALGLVYPALPLHIIAASLIAAQMAFALFISLPTRTKMLTAVPVEKLDSMPSSMWHDLPAMLSNKCILLLLLTLFLNRVASAPFNGFYTLFVRELGFGGDVVAWSWGLGVGTEILMMLVIDRLIERFGFPVVLTFGVLLEALRWLAFAFVETEVALLLVAPAHGIAFSTLYVASVRGLAEIIPDRLRALGQGVGTAATAGGQLAGFVGAGYLQHWLGSQSMFFIAGLIGVVAGICAVLTGRSSRQSCEV